MYHLNSQRFFIEMKQPSLYLVVLVIFCCSSALVSSQEDSCAEKIPYVNGIIFDATSFHCVSVWDEHKFILRYDKNSTNKWNFVLSYPNEINSWAAVGFSSDGKMVGSSAMVGWIISGGVGGTKPYYLGGTSENEVVPNKNKVGFGNRMIGQSQSLRVYLAFELETSEPAPYMLFAIGPEGSFPSQTLVLPKHIDKVSVPMDYKEAGKSSTLKFKRSHGVMNIAGWSILMIIGAIIARHFKQWDPIWFYFHASIQTIGFVIGIVGIICGFVLKKKISGNVTHHKNIGILILALGILQVIAFVLRPGNESKIRKYWNWYHHSVGMTLIVFAVVNTFYGFHLGGEGSMWLASYGIFVALLVVIAAILEIRKWMIYRRSSDEVPELTPTVYY